MNKEDFDDFVMNSIEKGGLECILPGAYYDAMKKVQASILEEKKLHFGKLRKEFVNSMPTHLDCPNIGAALNKTPYLEDSEVFLLLKNRFCSENL